MTDLLLHPVLPFVVAAAIVPLGGTMLRRIVSLLAPLIAFAFLIMLPAEGQAAVTALGHDWILLRLDGLGRVFAYAFILYALIAAIYAWEEQGAGPKIASLALAGAATGVVLAGDLLTLFFFWEWLTVASLFLIWFGNTPGAWAAGFRYLIFHLAGATVMVMGILMHMAGGITAFEALPVGSAASWLVLAGMVTNAAVPPLHAWLSDAYPRASVFGTVFLAAFTTKAAVYALARTFAGVEVLVWAGAIMAVFGAIYALLEDDIRRLLAYSIISQVGYMVAAVGMGSALALNGTAAHAFSHIFYKGLLLMAAGAVIHATGRGRLSELGRLARPLRWTFILMMIGGFSISGVPFFNGFVGKSMIVSAAAYAGRGPIELLLLTASVGSFLHTGLRLPWFTFFGSDNGARVLRPVPASMYVAMVLAAIVCFVTGVVPGRTLYALLPFDATYQPFTAHHFIEMLQLLVAAGLGFLLLHAKLAGAPLVTRDVDVLYRRPLLRAVYGAGAVFEGVGQRTRALTAAAIAAAAAPLRAYATRHGASTLAYQSSIVIGVIAVVAYLIVVLNG